MSFFKKKVRSTFYFQHGRHADDCRQIRSSSRKLGKVVMFRYNYNRGTCIIIVEMSSKWNQR